MPTNWDRLADEIRADRNRHHETRAEAAARYGLSARTVQNLESREAHSYSADTMFRVELSLGWQHGSFEAVVEGRPPTRDGDPELRRIAAAWREITPGARTLLAELAESMARLRI